MDMLKLVKYKHIPNMFIKTDYYYTNDNLKFHTDIKLDKSNYILIIHKNGIYKYKNIDELCLFLTKIKDNLVIIYSTTDTTFIDIIYKFCINNKNIKVDVYC